MQVLQQLAYQQQQTQAYTAQVAGGVEAGAKRDLGGEDTFDDFLADMKRRRVEPIYDTGQSQLER